MAVSHNPVEAPLGAAVEHRLPRPGNPAAGDRPDMIRPPASALGAVGSGRRDALRPGTVLSLQAMAGNQAVAALLARRRAVSISPGERAPVPNIQRLIVNVNDTALPALDAYNYTAMGEAFQADAGQQAKEFDAANYRTDMAPADDVYFVGHGSPGMVGVYTADQVVTKLAHPKRGLPNNFTGTIISLSCSTGVSSKEGGHGGGSAVRQVVEKLGGRHRGGIRFRGARGAYITHAQEGNRAIRTDKVPAAFKYQTKHEGTVKTDFEAWKKLNPTASPLERATEATRLTRAFIKAFLIKADRKGWVVDTAKTMKEQTSVAAPKKSWLTRLLGSCFG